MQLEVNTKDYKLADADQDLIVKKLVAPLEKFIPGPDHDTKLATLRLEKGQDYGVSGSFSMYLPGNVHIYAEDKQEELMKLMTSLRSKCERQIKEYKNKKRGQ